MSDGVAAWERGCFRWKCEKCCLSGLLCDRYFLSVYHADDNRFPLFLFLSLLAFAGGVEVCVVHHVVRSVSTGSLLGLRIPHLEDGLRCIWRSCRGL